jgi:hypothetical protein
MYRPNFCSDCGAKILRLRWYPWTSRRFCVSCAPRLRKVRLTVPLLTGAAFLLLGLVWGRATRPVRSPLIIERRGTESLYHPPNVQTDTSERRSGSLSEAPDINSASTDQGYDVYACGARTKKGTPCSRRVHGAVRCWQHKGMKAMLPQEKLIIKG